MTKQKSFELFVLIIISFMLILLFGLNQVSASTNFYSLNLSSHSFSASQPLSGVVNLTALNQESYILVDSYIDNQKVNSLSLLDFLNKTNAQITCENSRCEKKFTAQFPGMEIVENSPVVNESYFGFFIQGSNVQLQNFAFDISGITSNVVEVCEDAPFKIDVLGDGAIEYEYNGAGNNACYQDRYASQNLSLSNTLSIYVQTQQLCEKLPIIKTPEVEVFAKIDRNTGGAGNVVARIFDPTDITKEIGNCTMMPDEIFSDSFSCRMSYDTPNFLINETKDYYVCLSNPRSSGTSDYELLAERTSPYSGFVGLSNNPVYDQDFAIYVRAYSFAPFNDTSIAFNPQNSLNKNLISYIQNYISSKYNNNCTGTDGCVIPVKFISNDRQQLINISNIDLRVSSNNVVSPIRVINNILPAWPKVNVSNQLIRLDELNITAPSTASNVNHTFKLTISGTTKQDYFKIETTPQVVSLNPLYAIPGRETLFSIIATPVSGLRPISLYRWNFNDGFGEQTTTEPRITHVFPGTGSYNVLVTVIDNQSISGSKTFIVNTNLTPQLINQSLNEKINKLNNFVSTSAQENWYFSLLGINLTEKSDSLSLLKSKVNSSMTQQQMLELKNQMDAISIPENISEISKLQESSYASSPDYVFPGKIAEITETTSLYNSGYESYYKNAISEWQDNNLDIRFSGAIKRIEFENANENKEITLITITLDPSTNLDETFLIVQIPGGNYNNIEIRDRNSLSVVDLNDAIGFKFDSLSDNKYLYLAIPATIGFDQITMFASPSLNEFQVSNVKPMKEPSPPWVLIIIIIILILFAIAVVLFFIWKDYSQKLEDSLFKNRNDLYTLTSYISTNLARGLDKGAIKDQLLKAGWKEDQINYAFKKAKKLQKQQAKQTIQTNK